MSKVLFEEDSDSDGIDNIKTDSEYAKTYNTWRQKEEFHKLQSKYGNASSDDSSSSDDDLNPTDEIFEKEFFKTLSHLKDKNPCIYDQDVRFFEDSKDKEQARKSVKKEKERPMFLKDYERKLVLEKGGQISEDEEDGENTRSQSPTYVEEQNQLKQNLKSALNEVDDENEEEWGGLFKARQKTDVELKKEDEDYKEWLAGQREHLNNEEDEIELKPLKEFWSDPSLDKGEKFLRDYILNKRFLEDDNGDYIPTYEEIVHDSDENLSEDEKVIDEQEEFEHKYNFRYEEPDPDFIKRYPRVIENSLRRKDDKRIVQRAELKERKKREKEQKMQEINKLKQFKQKEIEEKIEKLKEITGNAEIAFKVDDFEEDFDPEEYDKRMQNLFNDEFYEGPEGDQKPEFADLDEELQIENWNKLHKEIINERQQKHDNTEPHCEDEDFNMDCDYDPNAVKNEEEEISKKKKRRRRSKFAKMISEPKPVFDPNNQKYEQYLDEYYKMDCEDIIGDVPCRFKYRKTIPNSYGLTIEEILMADDKELNRWCSIKKIYQHRPEHVEKNEVLVYDKRSDNEALKRKYLPSLFKFEIGESSKQNQTAIKEENEIPETTVKIAKKKKTKKNKIEQEHSVEIKQEPGNAQADAVKGTKSARRRRKRKANEEESQQKKETAGAEGPAPKKKKRKLNGKEASSLPITDARLSAFGFNPKKFKNKLKYSSKN